MTPTEYVKPWEVEPGDAIVGMPGSCVESARYAGSGTIGSEAERQRYVVTLTDGRRIPYNADSRVHVIRAIHRKGDTPADG